MLFGEQLCINKAFWLHNNGICKHEFNMAAPNELNLFSQRKYFPLILTHYATVRQYIRIIFIFPGKIFSILRAHNATIGMKEHALYI
jgi:hypothetical protein